MFCPLTLNTSQSGVRLTEGAAHAH
jgi:hypothetical protein